RGAPGDEIRQHELLESLEWIMVPEESRLIRGHGFHGASMQTMKGFGLQLLNEDVNGSKSFATGHLQQPGLDEVSLVILQHNRRLIEDEAADVVEFWLAEGHFKRFDSNGRRPDFKTLAASRPFLTRRIISSPS